MNWQNSIFAITVGLQISAAIVLLIGTITPCQVKRTNEIRKRNFPIIGDWKHVEQAVEENKLNETAQNQDLYGMMYLNRFSAIYLLMGYLLSIFGENSIDCVGRIAEIGLIAVTIFTCTIFAYKISKRCSLRNNDYEQKENEEIVFVEYDNEKEKMDKIIEICDELRKNDYSLNKVMLMKKKLLDYINQDEDNKEDRILQLKVEVEKHSKFNEKTLSSFSFMIALSSLFVSVCSIILTISDKFGSNTNTVLFINGIVISICFAVVGTILLIFTIWGICQKKFNAERDEWIDYAKVILEDIEKTLDNKTRGTRYD